MREDDVRLSEHDLYYSAHKPRSQILLMDDCTYSGLLSIFPVSELVTAVDCPCIRSSGRAWPLARESVLFGTKQNVPHILLRQFERSDRQKSSHAYYTAAAFPLSLYPPTTTMSDLNPYELRAKYTRFRILVIGRANAGKTTLLQRVCNTTEDPCIYDENNENMVSLH